MVDRKVKKYFEKTTAVLLVQAGGGHIKNIRLLLAGLQDCVFMMDPHISIFSITIDTSGISVFAEETFKQSERSGMLLTEQIDSINFRIRESQPGYRSDFHVAGDRTLIIIQSGILRIFLRNGEFKDFKAGDMFIAGDYLPEGSHFEEKHGHRAEVIGGEKLRAVHIKLSRR